MNYLKNKAKNFLKNIGLKISKFDKNEIGQDLNDDVEKILNLNKSNNAKITIFDVGSNIGQSINSFNNQFKAENMVIHAFEPSVGTFKLLENNCTKFKNIVLNNVGVGSELSTLKLYENAQSDITSFLKPTENLWGKIDKIVEIPVITLDNYCKEKNISKIDFLKIDTQGFDFEVLKGASKLISEKGIYLIQMEITLENLYENLPRIDEILKWVLDAGFVLVGFYGFHNKDIKARWTDALFVQSNFNK